MHHQDVHSVQLIETLAAQLASFIQRKQAENQIREHQMKFAKANQLNSISEIASTLAHELNQPLTAITTYTQACIRKLAADVFSPKEINDALQKVVHHSLRAGKIIHHIKGLITKDNLHCKKVQLNAVIESTVNLLNLELQAQSIFLELKLDTKLPLLLLDQLQIEQVLVNLIYNALEAIKETKIRKPKLLLQTELLTAKSQVVFTIIDNGPGIAEKNSEKLFDPYFTTKATGMGLGLAICRTIIEAHDGSIYVKNNFQGGACFQFVLPIRNR